ncbi:hypothetical protein Taro_011638, partial [Colocasia esculenta]|nr:hypothetical protein [Colocasia esculenta]
LGWNATSSLSRSQFRGLKRIGPSFLPFSLFFFPSPSPSGDFFLPPSLCAFQARRRAVRGAPTSWSVRGVRRRCSFLQEGPYGVRASFEVGCRDTSQEATSNLSLSGGDRLAVAFLLLFSFGSCSEGGTLAVAFRGCNWVVVAFYLWGSNDALVAFSRAGGPASGTQTKVHEQLLFSGRPENRKKVHTQRLPQQRERGGGRRRDQRRDVIRRRVINILAASTDAATPVVADREDATRSRRGLASRHQVRIDSLFELFDDLLLFRASVHIATGRAVAIRPIAYASETHLLGRSSQSPSALVLYHNPLFDMDQFWVLADDALPLGLLEEWTNMKKELHDLRRQVDPRKIADISLPSFQYLRVPPQSELPVYRRYSGVGDPYAHLKDFVYESAPHKYDRHLMAYLFRKSLDGPALEWFYSLPPDEGEDFQVVQERFLQQFQDRVGPEYSFVDLVAEKMKPDKDFSTYADRWRSLAAKVRCPMPEEENVKLLISNATPTYRAILAMNDISTMHQLYSRARFIQTQLKDSPIHSMFETPKARYAKKPQGPVTEGIQTNEQVGAVSNPQGPTGRSPYTQQAQQPWNNNNSRQPPPQGQNPPQDQRQYSQVPPPQNGYAPRKPNGPKRAQYPPLPESLADIFAALMSLNALRLPHEKANWNMAADQTKYCVYHRHPGHNQQQQQQQQYQPFQQQYQQQQQQQQPQQPANDLGIIRNPMPQHQPAPNPQPAPPPPPPAHVNPVIHHPPPEAQWTFDDEHEVGKGLGAHLQGRTKNVTSTKKFTKHGLGYPEWATSSSPSRLDHGPLTWSLYEHFVKGPIQPGYNTTIKAPRSAYQILEEQRPNKKKRAEEDTENPDQDDVISSVSLLFEESEAGAEELELEDLISAMAIPVFLPPLPQTAFPASSFPDHRTAIPVCLLSPPQLLIFSAPFAPAFSLTLTAIPVTLHSCFPTSTAIPVMTLIILGVDEALLGLSQEVQKSLQKISSSGLLDDLHAKGMSGKPPLQEIAPLHPNRCRNPLNVRSSLHPDAGVLLRELPFRGADHGLPPCVEGTDCVPHGLLFNVLQASYSLRPEFEGLVAEDIPREDGCPPLCIISHFPTEDQILRGATCSASYTTATATKANPDSVDGNNLLVPGFPWWSSIVPTLGDPKTQECWRSLLGTELSGSIHLFPPPPSSPTCSLSHPRRVWEEEASVLVWGVVPSVAVSFCVSRVCVWRRGGMVATSSLLHLLLLCFFLFRTAGAQMPGESASARGVFSDRGGGRASCGKEGSEVAAQDCGDGKMAKLGSTTGRWMVVFR